MKITPEQRLDLLKTLMVEDRSEIRGIRLSIFNITTLLATASFAITAFMVAHKVPATPSISLVGDGMLLVLLWLFFLRLKGDLYCARQCLVARQQLLRGIGTPSEVEDFDPFPDARQQKVDVTDSELWWLPLVASAAILTKAVLVFQTA